MSHYTEVYHTHALGAAYGWWGKATHPAHLDAKGSPVRGTEWTVEAVRCSTLDEAVGELRTAAEPMYRNGADHEPD